jgi:hypothetical protein
MVSTILLAAFLAAGPGPDAAALRRELDAVAGRIEALKARRLAGEPVEDELGPLLVRSQELAIELERLRPETGAPPAAAPPGDPVREPAEELHERATALRDEADHLLRACAVLDARILVALRSATAAPPGPDGGPRAEPAWAPAAGSAAPPPPPPPRSPITAIAPLVEQRMRLELRARLLEAQADRLELQARGLERGAEPAPSEVQEPGR